MRKHPSHLLCFRALTFMCSVGSKSACNPKTKLRAPCISTTLRQHCLDANTSVAGKTPRPRVGSRIFRQNQNQPAPNAVTTCSRFPLSKTLPAPLMSRSQRGCAGCQHQSEGFSFPVDEAINAYRGNGR
ncbi:hypothetical protein BGZ61DRAFT_447996 [Ilyonectria robusta]|uniref:uncharacterized protein n=1 Tax=Ilyonectria robusta TaxID=1079257 RepID=UPI001E8CC5AA|nr:uncharacterized protein BGZ61DRAFT_447996 [Ilyonectria robusta]KAH8722103.1 hypothetical protein BGZ61DRAFT_447996 [Ilyonectria robusta]